jgi:hypothetical protein
LVLYYLCSLLKDAYQWLTGASPAARPIALEEEPLIPHTDTDAERIVLNTRGAVLKTIFCLLCYTYVFTQQWIRADIVSLEHPLLRNVTSALMYTLRGLDILFVGFLIFVFVRWLKQRPVDAAAQAPTPLVQVLDDAVATKEEKEYVEAKA